MNESLGLVDIFFIEDELRKRELAGIYTPHQVDVMKQVFAQVCEDLQIPETNKEMRETLALFILNGTVQTLDANLLLILTKEKMTRDFVK